MVVNMVRTFDGRSLRQTLGLESDKFRCFSHRDELDGSKVEIGRVVDGVLYIAHTSYIYRDYVSQEVQLAILVTMNSLMD
jgi:hypothetical protein